MLKNFFGAPAVPGEAERYLTKRGIKFKKQADGAIIIAGDLNLCGTQLSQLPDLSRVIVEGYFDCSQSHLVTLKGAPGTVKGYFSCDYCPELSSLEGAPASVGGSFRCNDCPQLLSLEGGPSYVGEAFTCANCPQLVTLKGAPASAKRFFCSGCPQLTSLEGAPREAVDFICFDCPNLASLKGAPVSVKGIFSCSGCPKLASLKNAPQTCKVIKSDMGIFFSWKDVPFHLRKSPVVIGAIKRTLNEGTDRPIPAAKPIRLRNT